MTEPLVVIGGGIGGLCAAIRLQAAGYQVLLIERNQELGGKVREIRTGGYRWDAGPSILTMPSTFRHLFRSAGRNLDDYLTFTEVVPLARYFYSDGSQIDLHRDLETTLASIGEVVPQDLRGYQDYLDYVSQLYRSVSPVFIYNDPPSLTRLLEISPMQALRLDGLRTMQRAIDSFVRSTHLRQALGRFATYVGASPFEAPATLNVIGHVELNRSVWYPEGGINRLAEALGVLARELGVEIRTGEPVDQILLHDGSVTGVQLVSGGRINASCVLANADVRQVYETLLSEDRKAGSVRRKLARESLSSSAFILLLGVKKQHPTLVHHNIFFSPDYQSEFEQIFKQKVPPSDPTIYIAITSKETASDAPPGSENWYVMVNVPAVSQEWDWDQQKESYKESVITSLANRGYDLTRLIDQEQVITPLDLAQQNGAWAGAIYGGSSNDRWAAFRRPHNRARFPKGLYIVGGTVHPGGGMPMAALSGEVASRMVMADFSAEQISVP